MADDSLIFEVDFVELELVDIEFTEKELVNINLNTIDVLPATSGGADISLFIFNEIPTKINSKRFSTDSDFESETLRVFLNGIKEKYITIINSNTFEFLIDTITEDDIEVNYIKEGD